MINLCTSQNTTESVRSAVLNRLEHVQGTRGQEMLYTVSESKPFSHMGVQNEAQLVGVSLRLQRSKEWPLRSGIMEEPIHGATGNLY